MSIGTLVRTPGLAGKLLPDRTLDCMSREISSPEEQIGEQMLEPRFGPELDLKTTTQNMYVATAAYFNRILCRHASGTALDDWDIVPIGIRAAVSNVWDKPKLRKLMAEPLGTPIELTMEEADEIIRLAFGRRADLPAGKELVKEVRELLGHSLMERLGKID